MPDSYNGLSESQMAQLEKSLRSRQTELRDEVRGERADSESERSRRGAREVQDRGDEANTDQWRETNAAMIGHHEGELQAIQAALARISSETFGLCVDCGEAIGFKRLEAWPLANRCVACQAKAESG